MEQSNDFIKKMTNPLIQNYFLLTKLPAAYFSGVRVRDISTYSSVVTIPLSWFSKNPFHSIYFACLAMAAELSSGVLALMNVYKRNPAVSMLVVNMSSDFFKKATGVISFHCEDGELIREAVEETIKTGEGIRVSTISKGYNKENELVAEFIITWSFKAKIKTI
jgi:hypothetical protein